MTTPSRPTDGGVRRWGEVKWCARCLRCPFLRLLRPTVERRKLRGSVDGGVAVPASNNFPGRELILFAACEGAIR